MLVGVVAHTDHAVGQIAENTTAVLAGDDRKASAAYRMALLRSKEGIGLYLLDGNDQFIFLRVIDLDDAIEHYTRVILIAQVGNCRIAYLALRKVDIMSIALCKAAPGAHRHKLAFHARSNAMQILAVGEEVTLAAARKATGANGEARLTLDLDDNEVDLCTDHILQHVIRSFFPLLPHLRFGDHDTHAVGNHNGAVHGELFPPLRLWVPDINGARINADDRAGKGAAAAVGGVDGVPLLPLLRRQAAVKLVEFQLKEELSVALNSSLCPPGQHRRHGRRRS